MVLEENVPLAPRTTLGVGGPARYFLDARSADDVLAGLQFARERQLPVFILGGGSNLVVSDAGFPGLVLHIAIAGFEQREEDGRAIFEAGAGESWDGLVARAVAADCAGIECLSGIPGTVGGTPVQNVGAYGQEVSETITDVLALDRRDLQARALCAEACGFAYRSSVFNTSERGRFIILRVTYSLEPGGAPRIAYRDLKNYFAGRSAPPTLAETREAVRQIRRSKAMLIVPGDADARSAGSFFKNPVVSPEEYERVRQRARNAGLEVPAYPAEGQSTKIPAAWLVEHSGFQKGFALGPVGISSKHALAIVNRGGATAADVLALMREIQRGVRETFGLELHAEPVFVGFPESPGS
jgi:UDP-N-acetylmuramate dehydrogenase